MWMSSLSSFSAHDADAAIIMAAAESKHMTLLPIVSEGVLSKDYGQGSNHGSCPELKAALRLRSEKSGLRSFILRKGCETHEWQQCGSCAEARRLYVDGWLRPITSTY